MDSLQIAVLILEGALKIYFFTYQISLLCLGKGGITGVKTNKNFEPERTKTTGKSFR